jgi:formate dehydrogenase major subunit
MRINRREFIQISGAAAAGLALSSCAGKGGIFAPARDQAKTLQIQDAKETTTICPYCAVGCGAIVHTAKTGKKRAINIEGDPGHVINHGSLCSKGASLRQLCENGERITQPMYRAPYAKEWKKVDWDWALTKIAQKVKATRDATFKVRNAKGQVVNRTMGIASVGSAALDNEECWTYQALMRAIGLVYIEHQARI